MRMIKALVIVALFSGVSGAFLFSVANQVTQAQTATPTDVNLVNIKPLYKTLWFHELIPQSQVMDSDRLSSYGRGRLHILCFEEGLTGSEILYFQLIAPLWNLAKNYYVPILIATWELNASCLHLHLDMDVPFGEFYFAANGPAGRYVSLSYYLSV
jgi:hypothetical protein